MKIRYLTFPNQNVYAVVKLAILGNGFVIIAVEEVKPEHKTNTVIIMALDRPKYNVLKIIIG